MPPLRPRLQSCLKLLTMLKSFEKSFTKLEEVQGKEDWPGSVKLLGSCGKRPSSNKWTSRSHGPNEYMSQRERWCDELLTLDGCKEDVDGLVGRGETLLVKEEFEETVRTFEQAFESSGRLDRDIHQRLQRAQKLLKQSKQKDYYKILDVSRDADAKTIKKAYRKQAKKAHPDKGGSEAKMALLNEAYEVLSNSKLRQRFDNGEDPMGPMSQQGGHPLANGQHPFASRLGRVAEASRAVVITNWSSAMAQALQPSSGLLSTTNHSWRMRVAYHGDVEASASPGGIDCAVEDEELQVLGSQAASRVPDVNTTLPTVNSSEREGFISTLIFVSTWIYTKATEIVNVGVFPASYWCHYLFHCAPVEGVADQSQSEYSVRWEKALRSIARSWKATQTITTSLLLVSALTILQLDDILSNRAICTLMSASILLALASILSSFVYLLSKEWFISRWKASEAATSFWRCISMPLDFALWSFIFFISTIFMLIYERMLPTQADATIPQPAINYPQPVGAAFVAILSVIIGCKIYHGLKYFYRTK
ncbi:DnaJ-domain-containing protein [Agrocybe pediades]|nr:DnaJ-domain-containing protein [Agrocybe pediades]